MLPVEPLLDHLRRRVRVPDMDDGRRVSEVARAHMAAYAEVHDSTFRLWCVKGQLPRLAADRVAVALGMHPSEIWPEWFA